MPFQTPVRSSAAFSGWLIASLVRLEAARVFGAKAGMEEGFAELADARADTPERLGREAIERGIGGACRRCGKCGHQQRGERKRQSENDDHTVRPFMSVAAVRRPPVRRQRLFLSRISPA